MAEPFSAEAVLDAWFGDTRRAQDPKAAIGARMAWWFQADAKRDRFLERNFLQCCEAALTGELGAWQSEPRPRLALILLVDQLPRNLFRSTPRAFVGDDQAARLCLAGVRAGLDRDLQAIERAFFYMPLQHAEDPVAQDVAVDLFESLASEQADLPVFEGFAKYARLHRDLVHRFGRFPHRNEVLGRTSTPEEIEHMESGGETFGQG
jgi:uncharacterized protein (DUF924 family)